MLERKLNTSGSKCWDLIHFVKELTLDVSNVLAPPKQKSSSVQKEKAPPVVSPTTASPPKVDVKSKKPQSTDAKVVENGVAYDKNKDESAKSALNGPFGSSTVGSPSREFSDSNYGKTTDADVSPRNKESQSDDHAGAGSMYSGDNGSDEPAWGTFDTNDDVDLVWGFNAFSTTKIWANADQRQIGFLGQAEFYNALRLVTAAQSKRELMPEMVKAALYAPAAAKIPAPKINLAVTPAPQFNSAAAAPATQGGAVTPTSSQNLGFRGPQKPPQYSSFEAAPATQGGAVTPTSSQDLEFRGPQIRSQFNSAPTATQGGAVTPTSSQNLGFRGLIVNVNQQNFISQDGKSIRPPVPPSSSDSRPTQDVAAQGFPSGGSVGGPQPQNSSMSNDWVGGRL